MWKLRTHLLTHSSPKKLVSKRGDHEYAEPLKTSSTSSTPPPTSRKTISDHPYANPTDAIPAPEQNPQSHRQFSKNAIKEKEIDENTLALTKARAERVSNEHSYGTRQRLASIRESDHAYSSKIYPEDNQNAPEINNDDDIEADHDPIEPEKESNIENRENDVSLVQVLSVIQNEQPPPGSSIIAQAEPMGKLIGSAKRKAGLKSRKLFEAEKTKKIVPENPDEIGNYDCEFCGKSFPQYYRRNRHVMEVHQKLKRHSCQFCEKSFFKVSSKKRHELTHIKHDTWKCSKCEKTFKDQSSLRYHSKKNVCMTKKKEKRISQ